MKSYDELLEETGYVNRRKDFDDVLRILDGEFRFITSIDRADNNLQSSNESELSNRPASEFQHGETASENTLHADVPKDIRHYQLAHDYLVHSVRDWLFRKQSAKHIGAELSCCCQSEPLIGKT